jgi:hypothetical protein
MQVLIRSRRLLPEGGSGPTTMATTQRFFAAATCTEPSRCPIDFYRYPALVSSLVGFELLSQAGGSQICRISEGFIEIVRVRKLTC